MKKLNYITSFLIVLILVLFVANPKQNMDACFYGITVWATSWLPALFPFFVLTKLLSELGLINKIANKLNKITKKLFNVSGIASYIYTFSIISGYPIGAKLTADYYEKGLLTREEAHKVTTFTSNSGPMFIIGTVAIGMFNSASLGIIVLVSHIIGATLNGILFRNYKLPSVCITDSKNEEHIKTNNFSLEEIMFSSIKSMLVVGGYIALFFMLITMVNNLNVLTPMNHVLYSIFKIFGLPIEAVSSITNGIIEMTRGCLDLSRSGINLIKSAPIITAIITFGGFSIHMQALTFLKKFNISTKFYFFQKLCHVALSTIISIILSLIFL